MLKNQIQPKRKAELQDILKGFGRVTVRQEVINVIIEVRKVPLKEAQNIKTLLPSEVKLILQRFDYEIEA
jgi:hypothetical protein